MCDMYVNSTALGKVLKVLGKRRAQILDQEMRGGTDYFNIQAYLPVFESFGFSNEMRDATSGIQMLARRWMCPLCLVLSCDTCISLPLASCLLTMLLLLLLYLCVYVTRCCECSAGV